ncbi:MAG TPA: hypothetical protein VMH41_04785 [Mycobacteriales bacterium]|nr:hypothetical protein [Mycobacteriales bacterium]
MTAPPRLRRTHGEGRVGPFATFVDRVRPDGVVARWGTRRHRKQPPGATTESTWWAPAERGWWIGVLFAVGSLLFAVGAIPAYATSVGVRADSVTFFVGSLFFTSAGFLTYREAVDAGPPGHDGTRRRFFVYQPHRIDWWSTSVQLVGTLCFNVSTGYAIVSDLSAHAANRYVWRPDAVGSICFLIASGLAWFEVCHGWTAWRPRSWSWWITGLNLLGSIAFGGSAIAGYINPATGELRNAARSNLGTLIGAICFLAGALMLLPERTAPPREAADEAGGAT